MNTKQLEVYNKLYNHILHQGSIKKTSYLQKFGRAVFVEIRSFLVEPESKTYVDESTIERWPENPLVATLYFPYETIQLKETFDSFEILEQYKYFTSIQLSGKIIDKINFESFQHLQKLHVLADHEANDMILFEIQHLQNLEELHLWLENGLDKNKEYQLPQIRKLRIESFANLDYTTINIVFSNIESLFSSTARIDSQSFPKLKHLEWFNQESLNAHQFMNLESLILHDPEMNEFELYNLSHLTKLSGLHSNFDDIQYCTNLQVLELPRNENQIHLDRYYHNSNIVFDFRYISNLTQLTELVISCSFENVPNTLNQLTNLKKLYVHCCNTENAILLFNEIQSLTELEEITILGYNYDYTNGYYLIDLNAQSKLKKLKLRGYNINLSNVYIESIEQLCLERCCDTNDTIYQLNKAVKLKVLEIDYIYSLKKVFPLNILNNLPRLEFIYLNDNVDFLEYKILLEKYHLKQNFNYYKTFVRNNI